MGGVMRMGRAHGCVRVASSGISFIQLHFKIMFFFIPENYTHIYNAFRSYSHSYFPFNFSSPHPTISLLTSCPLLKKFFFSAAHVHLDVWPSTEAWATTNGHTPKKTPPASLIINTQIVPRIREGTFWATFHTCGNFYCHLPPFRQFFICLEFTNLTRLACQWAVGTLLFLPAQCWESRVHSYSQHFYVGSCSQVHLLMLAKQMSYWHLHKLFKIVFEMSISHLKMLQLQTKTLSGNTWTGERSLDECG